MSDVMIEAKGLGKRYGNVTALHNASFQLHRGEILGLLGPNGAGKSTTMKILTCFIAPTAGNAWVNGADIWDRSLDVRSSIGYLPESTPLYSEMLVLEYLEWVAAMRGLSRDRARKRILRVVDEVDLGDVIAKSIRELSKGYRQRVGLAQALLHEPPILILDEPMSGLDPNQAVEIRALIKEIGKDRTIILSTHNLAEVQVSCQRVLIISKGRIVADDTPEALSQGKSTKYQVTVLRDRRLPGHTANGKSFREIFQSVEGIAGVRELGSPEGYREPSVLDELTLELDANVGTDLRAEIFTAAVQQGLILLGMKVQAENLEQVFRQLTVLDSDDEEDDLDDEEDDDFDDDIDNDDVDDDDDDYEDDGDDDEDDD